MTPGPPPKVVTRLRDGRIHAYVAGTGTHGMLEPAAVFPPRDGEEAVASVVRQGPERVVRTTPNGVVRLTRAGDLVRASDLEPRSRVRHCHRPGCALPLDGRTVWAHRPDTMAGRGGGDQWVVHDAGSGAVLARCEPETVGHGASHRVHPVDGSVCLDIGEGQDGSAVLRGTVGADSEPEFVLADRAAGEGTARHDGPGGGRPDDEVLAARPAEASAPLFRRPPDPDRWRRPASPAGAGFRGRESGTRSPGFEAGGLGRGPLR